MPEFAKGGVIKGPNPSSDSVPCQIDDCYYALPASVAKRRAAILAQINADNQGGESSDEYR